jgi:hypothetical protein
MGHFCSTLMLANRGLKSGPIWGNVSDDMPLEESDKSPQNQVSNMDIYEAIMSTSNNLENRILGLEAQVIELKRVNKEIQDKMKLLVSTIAIKPSLRANTKVDLNPGSNTSQVMKKVPSIFLLIL